MGAKGGSMTPRCASRSPPGIVPSGALPPNGGCGFGAVGEAAVDIGRGAAGGLAPARPGVARGRTDVAATATVDVKRLIT